MCKESQYLLNFLGVCEILFNKGCGLIIIMINLCLAIGNHKTKFMFCRDLNGLSTIWRYL